MNTSVPPNNFRTRLRNAHVRSHHVARAQNSITEKIHSEQYAKRTRRSDPMYKERKSKGGGQRKSRWDEAQSMSAPSRYATSPLTLCRFVLNDRSLTCARCVRINDPLERSSDRGKATHLFSVADDHVRITVDPLLWNFGIFRGVGEDREDVCAGEWA